MRILVTGISGFLGWNLARRIAQQGRHEVAGSVGRHDGPPGIASRRVDLESPESIRPMVEWARPEVVIHTAALSGMGDCERDPDRAMRINVEAVGTLCEALAPTGARLVHCSTDLVFGGDAAPYTPTDPARPLSAYGRSKAAGERHALDYEHAAVARLALLYGVGSPAHGSFLRWLDAGLRDAQGVTLFHDEYRTALWADDAIDGLLALAEHDAPGIWHFGGAKRMSRVEFGRLYAEAQGLDASRIVAVSQADAPGAETRPADVSLDSTDSVKRLGWRPHSTGEALEALRSRFERGETP